MSSRRCGLTRQWIADYSLFHYVKAKQVLEGTAPAIKFLLPAAVAVVAIAWSLFEFPRRDLAAPA